MAAVTELATAVGTRAACRALFAPRASYYRKRRAADLSLTVIRLRPSPARALPPGGTGSGFGLFCTEKRFQIARQPLFMRRCSMKGDISSIRSMYRLLEARGVPAQRRDQLEHRRQEARTTGHGSQSALELGHHQTVNLCLSGPTLPLRDPGCFQPLRHRLDGLAMRESAELAKRLIAESCTKAAHPNRVSSRCMLIRGTSMSSKPVAFLLADLGSHQNT